MGAAAYLAWDGQKWAMSNNIYGVSDGSEAPPGMVGEFVYVYNQGTSGTAFTFAINAPLIRMATLNLSPGDWEVASALDMWVAYPNGEFAGGTNVAGWGWNYMGAGDPNTFINTSDNSFDQSWYMREQQTGQGLGLQTCFNMGPVRSNSASPVVIGLWVQIQSQSNPDVGQGIGQGNVDYAMWARRIR